MTDRIEDFVIEAREHLGIVEDSLLALERQPDSSESAGRVDRCFRSIQSIKGDAGFLGLQRIHDLAHAMESLLGQTQPPAGQGVIETLLAARDRLAVLVDSANRSEYIDIDDVMQRLTASGTSYDTIPIDIDLAEWNASHRGGVTAYVLGSARKGTVREGQLLLGKCDLRRSLPTGPVRWVAVVEASRRFDDSRSHMDVEHASDAIRTERFSIDLSVRSQKTHGLVGFFHELTNVARLVSGQVTFPTSNLRSELPNGPVFWSGECETKLTRVELARRFGVEFPKLIRPTESQRETVENIANHGSSVGVPLAVQCRWTRIEISPFPEWNRLAR